MVRLCHEYKCVIIFRSPLIAPPFKIVMKIPGQLLTFTVSLCSSSLHVPLQRFPLKTHAKVHINFKKHIFFFLRCVVISQFLCPLCWRKPQRSCHRIKVLGFGGVARMRFAFMYRKAGERKHLLCVPLEGIFQTKRRGEMKEWGQLSVCSKELDKWLDWGDRLIFLCWTWWTWMMHKISCSSE